MATSQIYRTLGSGTATTTYTLSMWVKRTAVGAGGRMFSVTGSGDVYFRFNTNDTIELSAGGGDEGYLQTNRTFADPAAWYHIVIRYDTTESTATDRFRLYINGVDERDVGGYSIDTMPGSSVTDKLNLSGNVHRIASTVSSQYFAGCLSHAHLCVGYSYAPTVFGETDATSGIWKIKTEPSVTYGTNGWFLKFEDRSNLDLDSSPNAHTFTTAGTPTATYDNPSNNFCTMNPLDNYELGGTFTNGNTTVETRSADPSYGYATGTLGGAGGKWYWEMKLEQAVTSTNYIATGIAGRAAETTDGLGYKPDAICYQAYDGKIRDNTVLTTYGNTWTTGDIIGVAMDLDNSKLYFSINGTWQNSGVPTSGATGTGAHSMSTDVADTRLGAYLPAFGDHAGASFSTGIGNYNFGNGYFKTTAISSAGTNAGVGEFEYDVPASYYALCTKNIKSYGG